MIFINGKDLKLYKRNMHFLVVQADFEAAYKKLTFIELSIELIVYITSFIHLHVLLSIFHRIPYMHIFLIRKKPELKCMLPCNQWRC